MKKYLIIAAIALAVSAVVTIWVQRSRINTLTGERDKYRTLSLIHIFGGVGKGIQFNNVSPDNTTDNDKQASINSNIRSGR